MRQHEARRAADHVLIAIQIMRGQHAVAMRQIDQQDREGGLIHLQAVPVGSPSNQLFCGQEPSAS